jgi:hypothetical protein
VAGTDLVVVAVTDIPEPRTFGAVLIGTAALIGAARRSTSGRRFMVARGAR